MSSGDYLKFGKRLKEERIAAGYTQAQFAEATHITREAQGKFERDVHMPNSAYLLAAAALGIDIHYILTGMRGALNEEESALLARFREADEAKQKRMLDGGK